MAGSPPPTAARAARIALVLLAALALLTGVLGGLVRLGIAVPAPGAAVQAHGSMMVVGFLGTVISLERAVAVGGRLALAAPLTAGLATVARLGGAGTLADALAIAAPLLLVALSAIIVRRQRAMHTVLLLVAALAWLVGDVLHALARSIDAVAAWWFAFLVLTVAAERLELTRLMRRRPFAQPSFVVAVALLIAGAAAVAARPDVGFPLYGVALLALAAWLFAFDLARRTVRTSGFARYAAVALLAGYAWLAVAGAAWIAMPAVAGLRDVGLHALGLGFVVSMIFAHAPIVVPVIARTPVRYTPLLYAPLALLHLSLLLRLFAGPVAFGARQWGSVLNALAIAAFAGLMAYALARPGTPARTSQS